MLSIASPQKNFWKNSHLTYKEPEDRECKELAQGHSQDVVELVVYQVCLMPMQAKLCSPLEPTSVPLAGARPCTLSSLLHR